MSGSCNAVTWLLDRNVDEGRGAKLAFTDTVSELTYGDLQRQSRRVANMLRRLGVRREERVAMIMLDTVTFLPSFSARSAPASCRSAQYAADLGSICLCAGRQPRTRAVRFRGAVSRREGHRRRMPDLEHVVLSGTTRSVTRSSPTNPQRTPIPSRPCRPMPRSRHFGSIRPAPPACRRACGICIPACRRPPTPMATRCLASARASLPPRQNCFSPTGSNALTFPMSVGASTVLNAERPTPARMYDPWNKYNPTIFYGAPTLFAADVE